MDNIMNPPIELEWGPAEIVLAYNDSKNTKRVAKTFCITDKEGNNYDENYLSQIWIPIIEEK